MMDRLKSRKLWVTLLGGTALGGSEVLDLSNPSTSIAFAVIIGVYLVSQGVIDAITANKGEALGQVVRENEKLLQIINSRNANNRLAD